MAINFALFYLSIFQFHKGTIRTMVDLASLTKDNIDFNSIKVRLELISFIFLILISVYFNSIKVRLEQGFALLRRARVLISIP